MARSIAHFHGFLNIDKPLGITSTDVVRQIRRLAHQKQVGHGGTLDPLATGVLPVALGQATRLLEYLQEEETKRYVATVQLGASTTTDDSEGEIVESAPVPPLSAAMLEPVLEQFRGTTEQVPPLYAAIRIAGRRLYDYARAGETVEVPPRTITILQLTLIEHTDSVLVLDVLCSKGTYIRALARDIGARLGCGAHLTALRRTQAGAFALDTAVSLADLVADPARLESALLPLSAALADWPRITVNSYGAERLRKGQRISDACPAQRAAAFDEQDQLVALVARADDAAWQPFKVFAAEQSA